MAYAKLLVAFDNSEGSKKALDHGIDLAKKYGADLTVLHVVKEPKRSISPEHIAPPGAAAGVGPGMGGVPGPQQGYNESEITRRVEDFNTERNAVLRQGEEVMSDAYRIVSKEAVQSNYEVLAGDPAKTIVEHAEQLDCDLIVIGNRGVSGLKKWWQGSVSQQVTEEANSAVLVVK